MKKEGPEMADEVMTIPEVADYLKVTRQTIHKLIKSGKLKVFKIGRSTRILRSEVERFIQEQMKDNNG
jgi:excisionase family DNA binding protein